MSAAYSLLMRSMISSRSLAALQSSVETGSPEMFALNVVVNNSEKTRDCIVGTATPHLQAFVRSRSLVRMLSEDELRYEDVASGKTAVFLVTPDENPHMNALVSIFVSDLYSYLVESAARRETCSLGNRVNFLLDEFANFPRIDSMPMMLSASRSRNIRFVMCVQSLNQLRSVYNEDADTIKGNALLWIYLNSKDLSTLNEISSLTGYEYSTVFLQRMKVGQALILMDREPPRLSSLSDIDDIFHECCDYVPPRIEKSEYRKETDMFEELFQEDGPVKDVPHSSFSAILTWALEDDGKGLDLSDRILRSMLFRVSNITSVGLRRYLHEHFDEFCGCTSEVKKACMRLRS